MTVKAETATGNHSQVTMQQFWCSVPIARPHIISRTECRVKQRKGLAPLIGLHSHLFIDGAQCAWDMHLNKADNAHKVIFNCNNRSLISI